jgi:hypothetical protein
VCAFGVCLVLSLVARVSADLVGYWPLDEAQGTTAYDSSGNGHDGELHGDPQWVAGKIRGALELDGDGDYVEIPDHEDFHLWERFSLTAWIYQVESRSSRIIDKITPGTSDGPHLDTHPGMVLRSCSGDCVSTGSYSLNEWHHVAVTFDAGDVRLYIDGALGGSGAVPSPLAGNTLPVRLGADGGGASLFHGVIDDAAIFNHALTEEEIRAVMAGVRGAEFASDPVPEDASADVPCDVTLGWEAGEFAAAHDVYFGTAFDDVNDASRAEPRGVSASERQDEAALDMGRLEFGQIYYWRVDEVNAAPDYTIFKGPVWSFTVEPFSYPIANITATASTEASGGIAQNTVNGAGLNANDEHSIELNEMWMSSGVQPNWIQYEFDKAYTLDELWVWNSNQMIEPFIGFGAKTVTIEYSADGETWTILENVPEFAKGTGAATYKANTVVEFGGVVARYVRLTIEANWGGLTQTGLSEVRFFYVPVQAFRPEPADDAASVSVTTELNWRPGREATSHTLAIGADKDAVAAGTVAANAVEGHSYSPASLDYATTYFWKVDAAGDAGTYAGDVWSFTTEEFAIVDDFESYNDGDHRIYTTWVDGLTTQASGSQVGYDQSPFAERTIVHGGRQAMPLIYNNADFAFSEATRTFESVQDWTARGVRTLSVFFQGAEGNTGTLYVKINNTKVVYNGDAADVARTDWQVWTIDLSTVGGNLAKVTSLTIGVEGAAATGTLYIDDIRLAPEGVEFTVPAETTPSP